MHLNIVSYLTWMTRVGTTSHITSKYTNGIDSKLVHVLNHDSSSKEEEGKMKRLKERGMPFYFCDYSYQGKQALCLIRKL